MTRLTMKSEPALAEAIRAAAPDYRKREFNVCAFPATGVNINSYWDGGSRDQFALVDLQTMRLRPLPTSHPAFDMKGANAENDDVKCERGNVTLKRLIVNVALVRFGYFCGKPATACVFLHPENMAKLLPATAQEAKS